MKMPPAMDKWTQTGIETDRTVVKSPHLSAVSAVSDHRPTSSKLSRKASFSSHNLYGAMEGTWFCCCCCCCCCCCWDNFSSQNVLNVIDVAVAGRIRPWCIKCIHWHQIFLTQAWNSAPRKRLPLPLGEFHQSNTGNLYLKYNSIEECMNRWITLCWPECW